MCIQLVQGIACAHLVVGQCSGGHRDQREVDHRAPLPNCCVVGRCLHWADNVDLRRRRVVAPPAGFRQTSQTHSHCRPALESDSFDSLQVARKPTQLRVEAEIALPRRWTKIVLIDDSYSCQGTATSRRMRLRLLRLQTCMQARAAATRASPHLHFVPDMGVYIGERTLVSGQVPVFSAALGYVVPARAFTCSATLVVCACLPKPHKGPIQM